MQPSWRSLTGVAIAASARGAEGCTHACFRIRAARLAVLIFSPCVPFGLRSVVGLASDRRLCVHLRTILCTVYSTKGRYCTSARASSCEKCVCVTSEHTEHRKNSPPRTKHKRTPRASPGRWPWPLNAKIVPRLPMINVLTPRIHLILKLNTAQSTNSSSHSGQCPPVRSVAVRPPPAAARPLSPIGLAPLAFWLLRE